MAESNEENNDEKSYFQNSKKNQSDLDESDDENEDSNPKPDIGLGSRNRRGLGRKIMSDISSVAGKSSSPDNLPRREENPFSFKHFLNRDCSSSFSTGGARPKVFSTSGAAAAPSSPSTNNSCPSPSPRLMANPELTSGLPDFVQDHLVIEQCYLSNSNQGPAQLAVDLDKLPDFAPVPSNDQWNTSRQPADIPFDLTSSQRERINDNPPEVLPLDLPESFPFDLPSTSGEVGASKSLPDFLSDGPIHSDKRNDNSQPSSEVNSPSAPTSHNSRHSPRLQMENERLRRDLDTSRRQLIDQVRRNELLEAELASLRNREYDDAAGLEKMIEQIEDNLKRTTKRAVNAENRVSKLKQEIKTLTNELIELRGQGGVTSCDKTDRQRLACELRAAASSAELSLRQLLSGVDNLRVIASTLENRHRIEEDPSDFLDSDSISEPGPAL